MPNSFYDAIVIGAGHAGLSISYYLKQHGISHIIFERGRIGESWKSQRWDSFTINTPSWANILPGLTFEGDDPDGFFPCKQFTQFLDNYAAKFQLPVAENTSVISLESSDDTGKFCIKTSSNGKTAEYCCNYAVVASGIMNEKNIPSASADITAEVLQLHASQYRNPSQLPEGAVLVVGSAQSGVQITEDLAAAGRKVYLSTSKVPRARRRYRGKDMVYWFINSGFWDVQTRDIIDPAMFSVRQPQISGAGFRGHTVSLQWLHEKGVEIIGRLDKAIGDIVYFQPNAAEHVMFADEFSKKILAMADEYIHKNNINAPPPETDEADEPDPQCKCASNITELNLKEKNISSIIWTTGFGCDFSWIKLPVIDEKGIPIHNEGVTNINGLYFLGFPWLRKRKSGIIYGIAEDAEFIVNKIIKPDS